MTKLLVAVALLGTVGCNAANEKVSKFADEVCACKDKTCAKTKLMEFVTWAEANKNARGDEKKAEQDATRLAECAVKAGVDPQDLATAGDRLSKLAD